MNEHEREEVEDHLYSCDTCLSLYYAAIEGQEDQLPTLSNDEEFTELIMSQVAGWKSDGEMSQQKQSGERKPLYQSAIFHYAVAAAMTLLLMTTGVFQSVLQYVDTVQNPKETRPSFTEEMMNHTFSWMNSIEQKNKEASK
jgi:anti-sigma factor RsiW